jgi:uncharacterized sodium:solute symporter family permease YidK
MILGFIAVGGVSNFLQANADRLHMILPSDHIEIPWTALVVGIWIPNFYYWGFNQSAWSDFRRQLEATYSVHRRLSWNNGPTAL